MPPYPFAELPTFAKFKSTLEGKYGCVFRDCAGHLQATTGELYPVACIERVVDGETLSCVIVVDEGESTRITWHLTRSVCLRLRIDPAEFGLELG